MLAMSSRVLGHSACLFAGVVAAVAMQASVARAAVIDFAFTGTVTSYSDASGAFSGLGVGASLGSAFSGSFSYDDAVAGYTAPCTDPASGGACYRATGSIDTPGTDGLAATTRWTVINEGISAGTHAGEDGLQVFETGSINVGGTAMTATQSLNLYSNGFSELDPLPSELPELNSEEPGFFQLIIGGSRLSVSLDSVRRVGPVSQVPELDGGSAPAAIMLLLGGTVLLTSRRRRGQDA
jgi:hypothetical protein